MVVSSKFWEPPDVGAIVSGQTVVVFRLKNNATNKLHKLLHACTVPPRPGFEFCLMKQTSQSDAAIGSATASVDEIGAPLPAAGVDIPAGSHVDIAVRIGERCAEPQTAPNCWLVTFCVAVTPSVGRFKQMAVFKFNGFLIGAFVNVSVINESDANVIQQQVSPPTPPPSALLILLILNHPT